MSPLRRLCPEEASVEIVSWHNSASRRKIWSFLGVSDVFPLHKSAVTLKLIVHPLADSTAVQRQLSVQPRLVCVCLFINTMF